MRALTRDDAVIEIVRPNGTRTKLYCKTGAEYEALLVMCNAEFAGPNWIGGPELPPPPAPPPRRRLDGS